MTLTEVLLAGALSVLFLSQVLGFLLPSMRVQIRLSGKADQVRLGTLALEKLVADLRATPAAGVSLLQEPQALVLALHRTRDLTGEGQILYEPEIRAYSWSRPTALLQLLELPAPQSAPWRLQPGELRPLGDAPGRRLVAGLRSLTVTHAGLEPASITSPLELNLSLDGLTLTRAVHLR